MTDSVEGLIFGLIVLAVLFLFAVVGAAIGALAGWVVGLTPLGTYILNFLIAANVHTNMVDFGAFCGFIGMFLGASTCKKD